MDILNRRIPFVLICLGILSSILIGQLISFQFRLNPSITVFEDNIGQQTAQTETIQANRGQIYDRDGVVLAVNSFQYRVGVSPALVIDRREAATQLATVLDLNEAEVYRDLQPDINGQFTPYIMLKGPIDDPTARAVEDLDINGVVIEPVALRSYPQGDLTAQLVGFVNYTEQGYYGVEGKYNNLLAGTAREVESATSPFNVDELPDARDGQSLVLTLDRDIQYMVQDVLTGVIDSDQTARGGTIIVMNPRTGEILGMVSYYPEDRNQDRDAIPYNPAISAQFEPGSVIKVVSAAIALQSGTPGLDLNWTYNNTGCFNGGGVDICDWDRAAKGNKSFRECLILSLNTCTATWFTQVQPSYVYPMLQEFGFGHPTGIDMDGEIGGILRTLSDPNWSEADYLNTSYGQGGITSTPLQMLSAVNAIANDGLLMQPHIVKARIDGNYVFEVPANPIERPISEEVAHAITNIMVDVLQPGTLDEVAAVDGYTIAGKTGTAQQPMPGGYSQTDTWASFVGFLPADDPIVSAIVVLDRPSGYWGSATAAPVFRTLMERLVVLLEIPPDAVRLQLEANGGQPFARR